MTDREAFEAWHVDFYNEPLPPEFTIVHSWEMWQAAIKHEREQCAKVCMDYWHELCDEDADIGRSSVVADCAYLIRLRDPEVALSLPTVTADRLK